MDASYDGTPGYVQFEYVSDGLNDLMAMSDIFISRAGANVICELAALKKPNVLIPLGTDASRGDQILNAESFEKRGFSHVLLEQDLDTDSLIAAVAEVFENRDKYIDAMEKAGTENAARMVADIIAETAGEPVSGDDSEVTDEEIMAAHMEEDENREDE